MTPAEQIALLRDALEQIIYEEGSLDVNLITCALAATAAQPVPAADVPQPGPWHDWHGGECPVAGEVYVDVTYANGVQSNDKAHLYYWRKDGASDDIIAWRYAAVTPVPAEPTIDGYPLYSGIPQPAEAEVADMMAIAHLNGMEQGKKLAQQSNAPALSDNTKDLLEVIDWLRGHLLTDHACLHMKPIESGIPAWIDRAILAAQGGKP